VIAGAVVLVMFGLLALACRLASGDEGGEGDSGWGGGGGNIPPPPRGPVDEGPVWWPDFERQFAAWVERTQRAEPVVLNGRPG
jgi:hypothetical protein